MTGAVPTRVLLALTLIAAGTNVASAQDWAQKMFDELSYDFGVVARGADVRHRFKFTNLYRDPVHISNVSTTCGCSAAKPGKETLASRESTYIEVTMNTHRFSRHKDSNLIVTFDQPLYAEVRIPVQVYIRTDVVLTPGVVNFGAVECGAEASRKIDIAYAGRSDWTIRDVQTHSEHLEANIVQTRRDSGRVDYQLQVALKPTAPVGTIREHITLYTDDERSPQIPVLVQGRVESDVTVTPSPVLLGTLVPGETKRVNVVIRCKKPFDIEEIVSESNRKWFTVRLPKESRKVHVLPMTVTPSNEPGPFTEDFTVSIPGRKEPLTFSARGTVAAATQ